MYSLTRPRFGSPSRWQVLFTGALATPWAQHAERVDLDAVARIKDEGLQRSQVLDTANMDVFDRLPGEDLMKNATIIASFVYREANRDELLPRTPLPKPRRAAQTGTP